MTQVVLGTKGIRNKKKKNLNDSGNKHEEMSVDH